MQLFLSKKYLYNQGRTGIFNTLHFAELFLFAKFRCTNYLFS